MEKNPIANNFKVISDNLESIVANLTDQYTSIPSIMNVTTILDTHNNSIHMELVSFPRFYTFIIISHLKNISTILFSSSIPYNNDIDTFVKIEILEKYIYELIKGFAKKLINFQNLITTLNLVIDWMSNHSNISEYFRSAGIIVNSGVLKSALDAVYHAENYTNLGEETTVIRMINNISKMITHSAKVCLATNNNCDYLKIFKDTLDEDTLEDCGLTEYLNTEPNPAKIDSSKIVVEEPTKLESKGECKKDYTDNKENGISFKELIDHAKFINERESEGRIIYE